jgi:RsiW-degrading membrane proteinase PrsW (M82 family)
MPYGFWGVKHGHRLSCCQIPIALESPKKSERKAHACAIGFDSCTHERKLPSPDGVVSIYFGGVVPHRKLPISLCVAQTTVTAMLTFWADRMEWMFRYSPNRGLPPFARLHLNIVYLRTTWCSVNAPTFPLNTSGLKGYRVFSMGEVLYLIAVAVLWYVVGYFYDRRTTPKRWVGPIAVLLWGAILLYLCIAMLPEAAFPETAFKTRIVSPLGLLNVSLYGVWGLVLIWFGVKNLRAFSQMQRSVHT